jgi:hypothetical protein
MMGVLHTQYVADRGGGRPVSTDRLRRMRGSSAWQGYRQLQKAARDALSDHAHQAVRSGLPVGKSVARTVLLP